MSFWDFLKIFLSSSDLWKCAIIHCACVTVDIFIYLFIYFISYRFFGQREFIRKKYSQFRLSLHRRLAMWMLFINMVRLIWCSQCHSVSFDFLGGGGGGLKNEMDSLFFFFFLLLFVLEWIILIRQLYILFLFLSCLCSTSWQMLSRLSYFILFYLFSLFVGIYAGFGLLPVFGGGYVDGNGVSIGSKIMMHFKWRKVMASWHVFGCWIKGFLCVIKENKKSIVRDYDWSCNFGLCRSLLCI